MHLMQHTPFPPSVPDDDVQVAALSPTTNRGARVWTAWHALELVAVFAIGVMVMTYIYAAPVAADGSGVGVPGNDSFYHIKMSAMMAEHGTLHRFPWLRFSWFSQHGSDDTGDDFISHHYGFHMMMRPFLAVAKGLERDRLAGGRWAICTFFGISLVLFHAILIGEGLRWRWIWLIGFAMLPSQFFGRHAFARAISPSLMWMLLEVFLLFRRRYLLAGLAVAAYVLTYLGGIIYAAMIGVFYIGACFVGPKEDRSFPWKAALFGVGGLLLGVLLYPYPTGAIFEFLRLQVFGSGLSPDIPVGREWNPYDNVWWFATMCGPLLAIWATSLALRLRFGPRLGAKEWSVLLINFTFFVLTLKAKRFIEYWPPFCLLSAALLAGPLVNRVAAYFDAEDQPDRGRSPVWGIVASLIALAVTAGLAIIVLPSGGFVADWQVWILLATLYMLAPIAKAWLVSDGGRSHPHSSTIHGLGVLATGIAFAAAIAFIWVAFPSGETEPNATIAVGVVPWIIVGGAFLVTAAVVIRRRRDLPGPRPMIALRRGATTVVAGILVVTIIAVTGGPNLHARQKDVKCKFDRTAVRQAMNFLKGHSAPGDVVFTDDWDIFPVYFYYNTHNNYIVGLDPKFTHHRAPQLWDRYVKVSRGKVPSTIDAPKTEGETGSGKKLVVKLEDIREYFGARYVITDRDHKTLAGKLNKAKHFAELIYPSPDYSTCSNDPYLIFRVKDADEGSFAPPPGKDGIVFLSALTPDSVTQGWGELATDRSVGGGAIRLGKKAYVRGVGTHAPSKIEYAIPEGYDTFEAVVGVSRSTNGEGSIVAAVDLDDKQVFVTKTLTGTSDPAIVRIPLDGATKLTLRVDPTSDGKRFDHVDWAMARFVARPSEAP
ncbi:MAG: NPCBM/NEW2 domain-containing protein [Planctomycetes bacterium]|nr:NPCBM/NEW2 domain-containing protein [Planctomycetota bacterium]